MQKSVENKALSLLLTLLMFLMTVAVATVGLAATVSLATPTAYAATPGVTTWAVTFDVDGGSAVPDVIASHGDTISRPSPNPIRQGYTFGGWCSDQAKTTLWMFSRDTIIADTTLYALWVDDSLLGGRDLIVVDAYTYYVYLADDDTAAYALNDVNDLEFELNPNGYVSLVGDAKAGEVYWGTATRRGNTYTLTVNSALENIAKYVNFPRANSGDSVYDANGALIGKGTDNIPYKTTYRIESAPKTSSSSSSSGGGYIGGGSQTTTTTSSNVTSSGSVSSTTIQSEAGTALKDAGNTATLQTKNAESISASTLKSLANAASGADKNIVVHADSTGADGRLEGRLYVEPGKLTGLTTDLKLGLSTTSPQAVARKAQFENRFQNDVAVVSCAQQGSFGAPLKIAARVELPKDTSNLNLYSFNPETKKYTKIETEYRIDKHGFIHFTTELAGDIIISDGPLNRKK